MNILLALFLFFQTSVYDINISGTTGNSISLSSFRGKKMLLVNIATGSNLVQQLAGLQQLQEQYGNNLVVIVFPGNNFGHETRSNSEISSFCTANYHSTFLIASKSNLMGTNAVPLFNWLAHQEENGYMDAGLLGDFQKFLINESGEFVGVFSPKLEPNNPAIIAAITAP